MSLSFFFLAGAAPLIHCENLSPGPCESTLDVASNVSRNVIGGGARRKSSDVFLLSAFGGNDLSRTADAP
jgi:hypothetical protein